MKVWIVRNDEGLPMDDLGQFEQNRDVCAFHSKSDAKDWADNKHAHVVELVDKHAPEVVSEAEAKILEGAKKDKHPCMYIAWKVLVDDEDRLMRAYVNGWTVEKPKRWNVKVPHTADELYWKRGNGNIGCTGAWRTDDEIVRNRTFTDAEIDHYGLQDCEKTEVLNED